MGRRPGAYICGTDAAMDIIYGKWKVSIPWAANAVGAASELRRPLPGVTEKVLAAQLRELEAGRHRAPGGVRRGAAPRRVLAD